MITRKSRKSQSSDALATVLKVAGANKLYSSLLGLIAFTTLLGIALPSENARATAQNAASALGGGLVAVVLTDGRSKQIQAQSAKNKALADGLTAKLADKELEAQQSKIELDARRTALDTFEATYKQRCENAAESRVQRQVNEGKRKIQAECDRAVRAAENKVKSAEKALSNATASHKKILAEAETHYQRQLDAAGIEKQVLADSLNTELAESKAALKDANQKLALAARELDALRSQQKEAEEVAQKRVAHAAKTVFESQSEVLAEAEAGSKEAIQRTALELQWEKQERIKTSAENRMLKAPKFCTEDTDMGRRFRKLHGAIHDLHNEVINEKGQVNRISYGFLMHEAGMRREGPNDVFSFRPCTSNTGNATELAKHAEKLGWAIEVSEPVTVKHNAEKACIDVIVPQGYRVPVAAKDVSRILKSSDEFLKAASRWQRVRITGGSESGKSPVAELIAYSIQRAFGDSQNHFYNPLKNSIKNHLTLPQVVSGEDECLNALIELGKNIKEMADGERARPDSFQFHVFDEVDTMVFGSKEAVEAIQRIMKSGSHYKTGIALTGQSSAITIFSNATHSDMNSLVRIAIGDNAKEMIEAMQGIGTEAKQNLFKQRTKVANYCAEKNAELGLTVNGPNQSVAGFRYCAVVEANKPVTFYEIPPFGSLNPEPSSAPQNGFQNGFSQPKTADPGVEPKTACENAETTIYQDRTVASKNRSDTVLAPFYAQNGLTQDKTVLTDLRLLDIKAKGVKCPHCGEVSYAKVNGRIRKRDSTLQMKCKTEGCASEGKFRAQIITD